MSRLVGLEVFPGAAILAIAALGLSAPAGSPRPDDAASIVPAVRTAEVPRRAPRLAAWEGGRWVTWWNADAAPARWGSPHPVVERAVRWRPVRPGIETAVLRLSGDAEAWRFNVALLRVDPARIELALHVKRAADGRALPWSVAELPEDAVLAANAGMFDIAGPWGWIVLDGTERQAPGIGPLSSALVVDTAGYARIVGADSIAALRRTRDVRWAVQSYPTALEGDGEVPAALRQPGRGVNLTHRDARLAVATTRDGRVLLALTRFDGLAGALDEVPFGPTLPEMTAVLGALGAQRAVFLDGGISAQMAVRDEAGRVERWDALRRVPLALVGRERR